MLADDLVCTVADRDGRSPRTWAAEPLGDADRVLEIRRNGSLVVDLRGNEAVVRGVASELPLRTNAVDGLCLMVTLPGVADPDGLFTEVRRVLRPAGTLVVVTPSAMPRAPAELILRTVHREGWPNRSALDTAGWLLVAADFAVLSDERVAFSAPVPDHAAAVALARDLPAAGLWPPVVPPERVLARLRRVTGPGGRWPVPLRRLVARR